MSYFRRNELMDAMPISTDALLTNLNWRYATKKFDASKKIPAETLVVLEEAIALSPSSYGLQPWKALIIKDASLRETLRPAARGQAQITDASHLVVFAYQKKITTEYIDAYIDQAADVRGIAREELVPYRNHMVSDLVDGPRAKQIDVWSSRQTYIALGMLLSAAAMLGIDACPMEGFEPKKFDEILGLENQGLSAVALCALGYRSAEDTYAGAKKVRLPVTETIGAL